MKIYHISLNEYKGYATSWEFFTNLDDAMKWVLKNIEDYAGYIEVDNKDISTLIEEFNESFDKYAMILTEEDMPNVYLKD